MVSTFRALAQYGNFDTSSQLEIEPAEYDKQSSTTLNIDARTIPAISAGSGMTINLNIELSIPTDATGEVYDKFFAAMRKHIINGGE